jgi:hypothetical protein
VAAVRTRAKDAADDNHADGTPVILADSDIEIGNWSTLTRQFIAGAAPTNAVRVTARRAGANAVPLMFARVIGRQSCDVQASAIVVMADGQVGFIGLNGITFHNNTFIGSYNVNSTTSPTEDSSTGEASVGSNGEIESKNNTELDGDAVLGPSGSLEGTDPDGSTQRLTSAIPATAEPAWTPTTNPLNLPQNYSANSTVTLPGGTYWFTSVYLNQANVTFSGPATVYVNGDFTVGNQSSMRAHESRPANLQIYQIGDDRKMTLNNDFTLVAQVFAPRSDLEAKNKFTLYGTAIFRTMEFKNNATIFLEESAMGGGIAVVR